MTRDLFADLRYAFRTLARAPGFTAVALLTLALGIGANTAIFSVVDAVLLRPLPYEGGDRLVWVWENNLSKGMPLNPASPGNLNAWRNETSVFESISAFDGQSFNLTDHGVPQRVIGGKVFADFFDVFGIRPALGRTFRHDEDRAGADPVVLLSHGLWQRRFGGDPSIVGRSITIDGKSHAVVGVIQGGQPVPLSLFELFIPFALDAAQADSHAERFLRPIGRLKPGVTVAQAQAELGAVARRLEQLHPQDNAGAGVTVIPLKEMLTGDLRLALLVLLGAVGLVLLIACVNVANLSLVRAVSREKEFALRAALGASRLRLTRQAFTEAFALSALGTAAGLALASFGLQGVRALIPAVSGTYNVPIPGLDEIGIDGRVLAFTVGLSFLSALLCGLAPALRTSGYGLNEPLKDAGRGSVSSRGGRLRGALVVTETALALVLLIAAGLMVESVRRLQAAPLGFDPRRVLTMSLTLPEAGYAQGPRRVEFFRRLLQRVGSLPGVESAAACNYLPLSGHWGSTAFTIEGRPPLAAGDFLVADTRTVTPGYFGTMAVPLVDGRSFDFEDDETRPRVVVINQAMARRYWPNERPVGRRVVLRDGPDADVREIIGVVGDVRHFGADAAPHAEIYSSHLQVPEKSMTLVVRTTAEPTGLVAAVRDRVLEIDPSQPIYDVKPVEQLAAQSVAPRRFAMLLLATFAVVALCLATIGIYGVISYVVGKRTREIGVRMALGASRQQVLGLVVGQGMKLAFVGIMAGLAGAVAATRALRSLLFDIKPFDRGTFLMVTLTFAGVALLACWLPARRAAGVNPMEALRDE